MKRIASYLLLSAFCCLSMALKVQPDAYMSAFRSAGSKFTQTQKSEVANYTLHYFPIELQLIRNFEQGISDAESTQEGLEDVQDSYRFMLELSIPVNGQREFLQYKSSQYSSYEERLKYFAFGFGKDIQFLNEQKEWQAIQSFQYERNFGISSQGVFLFEVPRIEQDSILILIHDRVYTQTTSQFSFSTKAINALPNLKKVSKWKK